MAVTKRKPIKKTLYKALKYITNAEKTDSSVLITGLNGCSSDPKSAFKQMRFTKQFYKKSDKIQAFHFMQSFDPGEVSPEVAHEIGMKWAKEIFGENFQGVLSTHVDKDHIHNHIIINSVSHVNGKKYDSNRSELRYIRNKSDKICTEYGLSIIEKGSNKNKNRKKKTKKECQEFWKNETTKKQDLVKEDIDNTILISNSFEEFISQMKLQGYEIKYGRKHISFKKGNAKAVRGTTIGEEYSEESIKNRIKEKTLSISETKSKKENDIKDDIKNDIKDDDIKLEKIGIVTLNKVLILSEKENIYTTKIPGRNLYIEYNNAKKINENTISVNIDLNKTYTVYSKQNQEFQMTGEELFKFYDDKTKELKDIYTTKIPGQNLYIKYNNEEKITEDTNSVNIDLNKTYTVYNNQQEEFQMTGEALVKCYDDKTKEFKYKDNTYKNYSKKSNYKYTPYNKNKKYICKNKNTFFKHKNIFKSNVFRFRSKYGRYRWNYSKPSVRNSLVVLLVLLMTKKSFEKRRIDITPVKLSNVKILENNIKNVQSNINILNKYNFNTTKEVYAAITKIEESKKIVLKEIKLMEETNIKNKLIADLIEDYIKYKPDYKIYKEKTGIKTKESIEFVRIYNVLKNFGIDNETKILEFRTSFDDFQEDLQNDMLDLKEKNQDLNKEKKQLEKIKNTIIDMQQNKYKLDLDNIKSNYSIER